MPSPIAASAAPASGKAADAAKAKPTMSFRSLLHFLLFRDAGRRLGRSLNLGKLEAFLAFANGRRD
jgi:hypothetical protein